MSLPASNYTSPTGNTVAGTQLAQTNNMLSNPQAPPGGGNPANVSPDQLVQAIGQQTGNLAAMQTPQSRQTVLNASDVPNMQNNYDQVARQLYNYDQMYLNPIYSQKPNTPSDALQPYGTFTPSNLFGLTPESSAGSTTLYANNPLYAVTSQTNQKGNILDLLDTLNTSIGKELTSKRGQYASSVASQKDVVSTLKDLLTTQNTKEYQDKSLQLQRDIANLQYGYQRQYHFNDTITQVQTELQSGTYTTPQQAIDAVKQMFPEYTEQQITAALGNPTQAQLDKIQKLTKSGVWEVRPLPGILNTLFGKMYAYNTKTGEARAINSLNDLNSLNAGNTNIGTPVTEPSSTNAPANVNPADFQH